MEGKEASPISHSAEYEDAYQEALTSPVGQVKEYQDKLEKRMADLLKRLQQKEDALNGQLSDSEREVLLAEKKAIELGYDKTVEAYEGLSAGFRARPENVTSRVERQFKKIELTVEDPRGDKGFGIIYDCPDKKFCVLYNMAIQNVLKEAGMRPFLQSGGWNESGWHMWELWQFTNHEQVEGFLEPIQKEAKALFEKYKNQDYFWEED